ncbi:hypothetical protein ACVIW2_000042 [Bradyrhizobium huanghuaihaiense]
MRLLAFGIGVAVCLALTTARADDTVSDIVINARPTPYKMYARSLALIVGASKYRNAMAWDRLDVVPSEATTIAAILRKHKFEVSPVLDPTKDELTARIREFLVQPVHRDTRLLLYFAGHGWTDQRSSGFIVPVDAPAPSDPTFLNWILGLQEIKGWTYLSKAKHILLVFDSCFSGSIFLSRHNLVPVERLYLTDVDRPSRQFITSGRADEQVPDRLDFSDAFVAGLDGAADYNKDGVISASELGYYLRSVIIPKNQQTPQFGSDTTTDYLGGDELFVAPDTADASKLPTLKPPVLDGPRGSALRSIGKPGSPEGALFEGIEVRYYEKVADGDRIKLALQAQDIPYVSTRAELPERFTANAIACGPEIPIDALKRLAKALIGAGIPVKEIRQFRRPSEKPSRIEILSLTEDNKGEVGLTSPNLTLAQIDALKSCPLKLSNAGQPAPTTDKRLGAL